MVPQYFIPLIKVIKNRAGWTILNLVKKSSIVKSAMYQAVLHKAYLLFVKESKSRSIFQTKSQNLFQNSYWLWIINFTEACFSREDMSHTLVDRYLRTGNFQKKHFDLPFWNQRNFGNNWYLIWKPYYRALRIWKKNGHDTILWAATPSWMKKHHFH